MEDNNRPSVILFNALRLAVNDENTDLVKVLIRDPRLDLSDNKPLTIACVKGNYGIVKLLLSKMSDELHSDDVYYLVKVGINQNTNIALLILQFYPVLISNYVQSIAMQTIKVGNYLIFKHILGGIENYYKINNQLHNDMFALLKLAIVNEQKEMLLDLCVIRTTLKLATDYLPVLRRLLESYPGLMNSDEISQYLR